jgi:hypothetical protein
MYLAFQNNHCPLEVPDRFQDKSVSDDRRRMMEGMSNCLDEVSDILGVLLHRVTCARSLLLAPSCLLPMLPLACPLLLAASAVDRECDSRSQEAQDVGGYCTLV